MEEKIKLRPQKVLLSKDAGFRIVLIPPEESERPTKGQELKSDVSEQLVQKSRQKRHKSKKRDKTEDSSSQARQEKGPKADLSEDLLR